MAKSIEEQIEDLGKKQLGNTKYYTKTVKPTKGLGLPLNQEV